MQLDRQRASLHQSSTNLDLCLQKVDYCRKVCFRAVFQIVCKFAPKAKGPQEPAACNNRPKLAPRSIALSAKRTRLGNALHDEFE